MKTDDKLMAMQLEVRQIEIALESKADLALAMQSELVRREILLKETLRSLEAPVTQSKPREKTLH